jgi:hypothetical protein
VTFARHTCWEKKSALQFLDTEAIQPPEHVFLATHHPVKMTRLNHLADVFAEGVDAERAAYSEEQLLRDFLGTPDFTFVAVLGDAGTGKSHLIRWMFSKIPESSQRKVLLIRREGTNLRSILQTILQLPELVGPAFDSFRGRLNDAARGLRTVEQAAEKLVDNLAQACGPNGPHLNQGLNEAQKELIIDLPDFLRDRVVRRHLEREGGVVHKLVANTLGVGKVGAERVDEQREFKLEDLPRLNRRDLEDAGIATRRLHNRMHAVPALKQEAVRWMNLNLNNSAIAELLEIKGNELLELMLKVRGELASQGKELVLLIEDFARMQGVDMQLLESLIVRPRADLCSLRTALGCTTGYFRALSRAALQRIDFFVKLDLRQGEGALSMTPTEVHQFVARYLNAVRLGEWPLEQWWDEAKKNPQSPDPIPNACTSCPYRAPCHDSFDHSDGLGLYPFTPVALQRMVERVSPDSFNPRLVILKVLQHILGHHCKELRDGKFPSRSLHEHFGRRLEARVNQALQRAEPDEVLRERRAALLDLWTDGKDVVNLDPGIHTAFALPALAQAGSDLGSIVRDVVSQALAQPIHPTLAGSTVDRVEVIVPERQAQVFVAVTGDESRRQACQDALQRAAEELSRRVTERRVGGPGLALGFVVFLRARGEDDDLDDHTRERLKELDDWQNGNPPSSELLTFIRDRVFAAIRDHVNWDTIPLLRRHVVGEDSRLFRKRGIQMDGQEQEQRGGYRIDLRLPVHGPDRTETARALQGMILFEKRGRWDFRDGSELARCYARNLEQWSQIVIAQAARPRESGQPWNPVTALVELLALKACLAGMSIGEVDLTAAVDALFRKADPEVALGRSEKWQELFLALCDHQETLIDQLKSHIPCTKGSDPRVQVIDVSRVLAALKAVQADWQPHAEVPADLWETYAQVREVRKTVDKLLVPAATEERTRLVNWLASVQVFLPVDTTKESAAQSVEQAANRAREEGVFGPPSRLPLEDVLTEFRARDVDSCLKAIQELPGETEHALLPSLGTVRVEEMTSVDGFLRQTREFLTLTQKRVDDEVRGLRGADELKKLIVQVGESLKEIKGVMDVLGGAS